MPKKYWTPKEYWMAGSDSTGVFVAMLCLKCEGACCETFSIPVTELPPGDEAQADINRWLELHATNDGERLTFECRCTKLVDGLCTIYEKRPTFCRVYRAGGPECLAAVRERRTPEQYERIREPRDPDRIHE